jgi:hypothetical protein
MRDPKLPEVRGSSLTMDRNDEFVTSRAAHKARRPFQRPLMGFALWRRRRRGGNAEGSIDHFDEVSLLAKNDPF